MIVVSEKTLPYAKQIAAMTGNGGPNGSAARKALTIIEKLQSDIDCRNFETNHGESRIRGAVKYDLGGAYRLVTVRPDGQTIVLCYIGKHDSAQHWLDEHEGLKLVKQTGSGRIEFVHTVRQIPTYLPPTVNPTPTAQYLKNGLPSEIITHLFPGRALRRAFETLTTDSDDEVILTFAGDVEADISREQAVVVLEICLALRDGDSRKARLHADLILGKAEVITPENPVTDDELRDPINADSIIVLNDLPTEEWTRLWHPTRFQDWMLWLHPDQKRVAEEKIPGPVVLDGVSGSGKTCVLVHRARKLAQRYPGEKVLILTLNRSLARLIERLAQRLCSPGEIPNIRVMAFHDYVGGLLKYYGMDRFVEAIREPLKLNREIREFVDKHEFPDLPSLFTYREESEYAAFWSAFFNSADSGGVGFRDRLVEHLQKGDPEIDAARYLREELSIAQSVGTLDNEFADYRNHIRLGRSIRFFDGERETTLRLLQVWQKHQLRQGVLDDAWLTQAGLLAIKSFGDIPKELRFRSVLIDEYQDFSSLELDLLRQIPTATADGLFLTGDQAQRVHTKHLDFTRAGLSTIQRKRIRKNYRNSCEILEAGQKLLDRYCAVETARQAGVTVVPPEFAARHSARPFSCQSNDPIRAAWTYADEWISAGNPPFSICIVTTSLGSFTIESVIAGKPAHLRASRLSGDYMHDVEAVVVSDAPTVKGFEFSLIIAIGLDQGQFPQRGAVEAELWRDALRLYVTITRARDELRFIYSNAPSPFLVAMAEVTEARSLMFPEATTEKADNQPAVAKVAAELSAAQPPIVAPVTAPPVPVELPPQVAATAPARNRESPAPLGPPGVETPESPRDETNDSDESVDRQIDDRRASIPPGPVELPPQVVAAAPAKSPESPAPVGPPAVETPGPPRDEKNDSGESVDRQIDDRPAEPVMELELGDANAGELNGITLMRTPYPCSQMTLVRLLGQNHTRIQHACYDEGLFLHPNQGIPANFVRRIMARFDCAPIFMNQVQPETTGQR
jgi:hypothetical protein